MPQYSEFQPKVYHGRMPANWFLDRWDYLLYVLRESSAFFVGYFAVVTLLQISALIGGAQYYTGFQAWLREPGIIAVNAIAFLFLMYHAFTWFRLVPRVVLRQMRGKTDPEMIAAVPNFALWLAISIVVGLFILRTI
ncbi:MAG: hypothetical protein ACREQN_00380 [Candidatus Binataceae bacterium]